MAQDLENDYDGAGYNRRLGFGERPALILIDFVEAYFDKSSPLYAGVEDALGDMDFKVAGTTKGITALQMDIKVKGITIEIMKEALEQARDARMTILEKITEAIPEHRDELSKWAPRMQRLQIPVEKIGSLIGPGGRVIRSIIEETGCSIDVEDDGTVFIGSTNAEMADKAIEIIEGLTKDVEVGAVYTGKVVRIMDFGAFVEIPGGKDGLIRIGELANFHVPTVEDMVEVGDEVKVKVLEVDQMGRINLSRKELLSEEENAADKAKAEAKGISTTGGPPAREQRFGGDRPRGRPGNGGGRGRSDFGGDRPRGRPGNGGNRPGGGGGRGRPGGGSRPPGRPSNRPGPNLGPGPLKR
ncbi:MAG: S1 RNA-binding domain-containing protein [Chloroflexi bacterium]|nr:S1 RNA-binding domain-containing protein [Chloroflexota bacterium]